MKLRYLLLLPALSLFALAAPSAHAQDVPFTLQLTDTAGYVAPNALIHFDVHVVNSSGSEQTLYVSRIENQLPAGPWMSQICTENTCYGPEENNPAPIVVAAKQSTFVQLSILAGETPNQTAKVTLRFAAGEFAPVALVQSFTATVSTSSVGSENRPVVRLTPVPNPASSSTLLPAKLSSANGLSVRLYDPLGRMAADLTANAQVNSDGVRISLDGLAVGTYYYQLDASGYRGTGTLVVSR
jgi:hypothetical protein